VARVVWQRNDRRLEVDIADFRAGDLESDLRARDVTINAMALPLGGGGERATLVDPAGGRDDLAHGIVRLLSPAVLVDDPLRSLRAVRLAAQLGFAIDGDSATWIAAAASDLSAVAGERIREELWKSLVAADPAATLRRLDELDLLAVVVPEVTPVHGLLQSPPHRQDVWEHTLSVVAQARRVVDLVERLAAGASPAGDDDAAVAEALAPSAVALGERLARPLAAEHAMRGHFLLAALFHDLGKARTRSLGEDGRIHFYGHEAVGAEMAAARLAALRFAQAETQHVAGIVRHHMRPLQLLQTARLSDRTLHRFFRATGEVAPEVCLLSLADNLAKGEGRARGAWPDFLARVGELIHAFFFRRDEVVAPEPPVGGGELVSALGAEPGPWVGELLRDLVEAKAAGEVATREQALEMARRWWTSRAPGSSGERAR